MVRIGNTINYGYNAAYWEVNAIELMGSVYKLNISIVNILPCLCAYKAIQHA